MGGKRTPVAGLRHQHAAHPAERRGRLTLQRVEDGAAPGAFPDLACPGLGPVVGTQVRIAGLWGGGLHATTPDGWSLDVVVLEWPNERVLLSANGGIYRDPPGHGWGHVFHCDYSTFRAAGFFSSGRTLAVATSRTRLSGLVREAAEQGSHELVPWRVCPRSTISFSRS